MAAAYLPHIGLLLGSHVLTADQGSYAITGQDAIGGAAGVGTPAPLPHFMLLGGLGGNALVSGAGSYSVTGQDASFLIGYRLACNVGFYTLSGQPALFSQSVNQGGNPAPLPHLGLMLAGSTASYTLTADPGAYGIFGSDGLADYEMSAATDTYSISGQDALFNAVHFIIAESGAYAITGQDADFTIGSPSRTMAADFGTYSVSGQDNAMSAGYGFTGEHGFYAVLGQTANLSVGQLIHYEMLAEHGDYQVFGIDADFVFGDPVLWAEFGEYTLTGYDVRNPPVRDNGGGYWHPPRRRRHRRHDEIEPVSIERVEEAITRVSASLEAKRALRKAQAKDKAVTDEIRRLLDQQDALKQGIASIKPKNTDDEDIAVILALALSR